MHRNSKCPYFIYWRNFNNKHPKIRKHRFSFLKKIIDLKIEKRHNYPVTILIRILITLFIKKKNIQTNIHHESFKIMQEAKFFSEI